MDFAKAGLLIALVAGGVELARAILPTAWYASSNAAVRRRATACTAVGIGQGATFLLSATVWAHEQVVGNHPLDKLNVASKVAVGVFAALGAAFADKALSAVADVGTPTVQRPASK